MSKQEQINRLRKLSLNEDELYEYSKKVILITMGEESDLFTNDLFPKGKAFFDQMIKDIVIISKESWEEIQEKHYNEEELKIYSDFIEANPWFIKKHNNAGFALIEINNKKIDETFKNSDFQKQIEELFEEYEEFDKSSGTIET